MNSSSNLFWDETFPFLVLKGPGSKAFLHGQTTSDIKNLSHDQFLRTCWLNTFGRVKALFEISIEDDGVGLLVLAGDSESVFDGLSKVIFPADQLEIASFSTKRRLQKISEKTEFFSDIVWLDPKESPESFPPNYCFTRKDLVEISLIQHGFPRGSMEINGDFNPFELGLADWVSLDKGCYLGQEAISKIINNCAIRQQLRYWESFEDIAIGETLSIPSVNPENSSEARAGVITSSVKIVSEKKTIGLALVKRMALSHSTLAIFGDTREVSLSLPKGFTSLRAV